MWIEQRTLYVPGASDETSGTSLNVPGGTTPESNRGCGPSSGTSSVKEWPGPAVGSRSTSTIDSPCSMVTLLDGKSSMKKATTACFPATASADAGVAGSTSPVTERAANSAAARRRRVMTRLPMLFRLDLLHHEGPGLAGVLHRSFVLDRRHVADVLAQDDGLEHPPHDLATAGLRQSRDDVAV